MKKLSEGIHLRGLLVKYENHSSSHLDLLTAELKLKAELIKTRPHVSGRHISKASRPMGLLFFIKISLKETEATIYWQELAKQPGGIGKDAHGSKKQISLFLCNVEDKSKKTQTIKFNLQTLGNIFVLLFPNCTIFNLHYLNGYLCRTEKYSGCSGRLLKDIWFRELYREVQGLIWKI